MFVVNSNTEQDLCLFAECKRVFDLFDRDHDGTISPQEVKEVLNSVGRRLSISHIQDMMKEVDTDGKYPYYGIHSSARYCIAKILITGKDRVPTHMCIRVAH